MRLKQKQALLDLTNKFLTDFSTIASVDGENNTMSYSFNYLLMYALSQSDFINNRQKETGFPTPQAGINLFTNLFEVNIQNLGKNLMFIFDNIDKQLNDDDRIKDLTRKKNKYHFVLTNQNVRLRCEVLVDDKGFKNLWIYKKDELIHQVERGWMINKEAVEKADNLNADELIGKIYEDYLYLPDHFQFTYIRDINSFYSSIENIYHEIEDEL